MVTLNKDEYEALRALSFISTRNILRRSPARVGEAAKLAKLSTQKLTALLPQLTSKRLIQKTEEGYLVTPRGERAIVDNFVPNLASIGANRQWIEDNGAAYWGRFVALRNNELVAEGADGRELRAKLRAMESHEEVLIVPLIEVGPLWIVEKEG